MLCKNTADWDKSPQLQTNKNLCVLLFFKDASLHVYETLYKARTLISFSVIFTREQKCCETVHPLRLQLLK